MTLETETPAVSDESLEQTPPLAELLGVSLLTGVVVIPLIMPLPKEHGGIERALFAKFQINDDEDKVIYDAIVPLDVLTTFSLNLVKACNTALENVRDIKDQDLLFIEMKELKELTTETIQCLNSLDAKFSATTQPNNG